MDTTQEPPPPPPPFGTSTELDPSCEVDVDLADNEHDQLSHDTIPEGVEFLGEFNSVEDYLRSMLEPEVSRGCQWILDCIDWREVQQRWEANGSRLLCERGQVYRLSLPPDPMGPWMPTRGC